MSLTAQPLPSADRPLLGRFNLPCLPLGEPPSPWQHLSLDARRVSVKNDGVFGPLYAGNKLRKLEFLLADAQQRGHDRVATVGAFGSNHALATATWAARLGLRCDVLHFPQPPSEHVRTNLAAIAAAGARLSPLPSTSLLPPALLWWQLRTRLPGAARSYWIPGGGSSPVGTLGFVNAALELCQQARERGDALPDRIYVAAGTVGTLAGLVAGLHIAGETSCRVVGVRVVDRFVCNRRAVRSLVRRTLHLLGARALAPHDRQLTQSPVRVPWDLRDDQFGPGYGHTTKAADDAVKAARDELDLYVETTYTAKVVAALRADLAAGIAGERPLYWHTLNQRPVADRIPADFDPMALPRTYHAHFAPVLAP